MVKLKGKKSAQDELIRMLAGFSQMHLPALMDELNKWHPPIDVVENDDKLIIIAEIAGIDIKNISITQAEDVITIQGIRNEIIGELSPIFHRMEVNYGPFERNIRIPLCFAGGDISAKYNNGFLRIEIEKNEDTFETITIE
ncbi:Hsp20/alpha crystallin family protein [bacterium]|nr:Hsp20/alpha crystallin family protein [bacterium]